MRKNRTVASFSLVVVLALVGCGGQAIEAAAEAPAVVEEVDGSEIGRITLTEHAADRLALETAVVTDGGLRGLAIPFAAVFWDANGQAWTYTSPAELVFVRAPITVARVDGDHALLTDGPPVGTTVVTVGVAELYGTETGVGGGH